MTLAVDTASPAKIGPHPPGRLSLIIPQQHQESVLSPTTTTSTSSANILEESGHQDQQQKQLSAFLAGKINSNNPFLTITPAQSPAVGQGLPTSSSSARSGTATSDESNKDSTTITSTGNNNKTASSGHILPPGVESFESFKTLLSQTFPELSDLDGMPPPPENLFVQDPARTAKIHQQQQDIQRRQAMPFVKEEFLSNGASSQQQYPQLRRAQSFPGPSSQQQQQQHNHPPTPPPLPHSPHLLPNMLPPMHPPLHSSMYPHPNDPSFVAAYMQQQYRQQMMARQFHQQQQQMAVPSSSSHQPSQRFQSQQQQGAGSSMLQPSSSRSMMIPPLPISTSSVNGSGSGGASLNHHSPSIPPAPLPPFMNQHHFADLMMSPDSFIPLSPVEQQQHQFAMQFQNAQQQQQHRRPPSTSSLMHPFHYQHQHPMPHISRPQAQFQNQQQQQQQQQQQNSQKDQSSSSSLLPPPPATAAARRQLPQKLPSSIKFDKNVDTANLPEQTLSMLAAMAPPEPAAPVEPLTPEEEEQQNLAKLLERPAYHHRPAGQPPNINLGSRVEPVGNPPRFKCACSKQFQKLCGLKSHIKVHRSHGERLKYDENNVLQWFNEKGDLVTSSADELSRSYVCEQCNKTFLRRQDLRRHTMSAHTGSVKKLLCPNCDGTFSRSDALYRHINSNRCRV